MIKPKYEVGYRFRDSRGFEFEVIEKNFTNSTILYYVLNIDTGVVGCMLEFEIDKLIGGADAKKPRKK